jgi:replicative DNA helicase
MLDAAIGGLKQGQLILIAGKPKNGKTALAQNIAVNVAKNHNVMFITLELLARETGVRVKHINGGKLPEMGHFHVQAKHRIDYRHIKPMFEEAKAKGVELVVLDYLQFLGRGMTNEEVAKMSKEIKTLALEYEMPFIVIVSLRKGDTKFKTKWTDIDLDDITGTAAIGYDADAILLASRRDPDGNKDPDHLYVKVVEIRHMPDTTDIMAFTWDRTRITEDPDWIPSEDEIKNYGEEEIPKLPYKD